MTTTVLNPPARGIVLDGISWETYARLLEEYQGGAGTRFTYDQGRLEIVVLSARHEKYKDLLTLLVNVLSDCLGIDIESFGSTTFRRADLSRGFEPDACFYIQHAAQVRGKDELNLDIDPPPDLVVEIDISHGSLDKFPLYAAVGVAEIWRWNGEEVAIYGLDGVEYNAREASLVLPGVRGVTLSTLMVESQRLKRTVWLKKVRAAIEVA